MKQSSPENNRQNSSGVFISSALSLKISLRKGIKMNVNMNWQIHLPDDSYNYERRTSFKPYLCNAHTHGMARYGHPDFQVVLRISDSEIRRILNILCLAVQKGITFEDGEYIGGIYDDCPVRLQSFSEGNRQVLRVIIPDGNNTFPEGAYCNRPYSYQLLRTDALRM